MYSIIVAILFAIEIASVLTFLTGASAKLKRAHVKRYTQCICAKRLGGLAVKSFPGVSRSFSPALLGANQKSGGHGPPWGIQRPTVQLSQCFNQTSYSIRFSVKEPHTSLHSSV